MATALKILDVTNVDASAFPPLCLTLSCEHSPFSPLTLNPPAKTIPSLCLTLSPLGTPRLRDAVETECRLWSVSVRVSGASDAAMSIPARDTEEVVPHQQGRNGTPEMVEPTRSIGTLFVSFHTRS